MPPIISAQGLSKRYGLTPLFQNISFTVSEGDRIGVIGPNGSGKSTLLEMLIGRVKPDSGDVAVRKGTRLSTVAQISQFAPGVTIRSAIETALERAAVPEAERASRFAETLGRAGFTDLDAHAATLSGGWRKRLAVAEALVQAPDILLLDEPFSQLDVLTAETLRNDLLDLWIERRIPTKGIAIVSHNIEEAVDMADRILIFSSDPGRISAEVPVHLPHPRSPEDPVFRQIVDQVYTLLTTVPGRDARRGAKPEPIGVGYRLPDAPVQQLSALLEKLGEEPYNGRADLPHLADEENLTTDELLPLLELLQLLGFANVSGGDIELTMAGRRYAEADMLSRKQIFAEALIKQVPLAAHIRRVLDERPGHRAPAARFLRELEDHLSEEEAERVLDTVINWGRHAEIFAYDDDDRVLSLENSYYSVISPEACSAILWRDRKHAPEAAEALKLTAQDLLGLGVVDEVVDEPEGGAHRDYETAAFNLGSALRKNLAKLQEQPLDQLLKQRYKKFRSLGNFAESKSTSAR